MSEEPEGEAETMACRYFAVHTGREMATDSNGLESTWGFHSS